MSTTKAQQRAVDEYVRENYDRISIGISKCRTAEIKAHAEARGECISSFVRRAINETMERDKAPGQ